MGTEVYGHSDDLIEIDGEKVRDETYGGEEPTELLFSDGTVLSIKYGDSEGRGIWKVTAVEKGSLFQRIDECEGEDADRYSDTAHFGDGIRWFADWRAIKDLMQCGLTSREARIVIATVDEIAESCPGIDGDHDRDFVSRKVAKMIAQIRAEAADA